MKKKQLHLGELDVTVFDTETTGLDPRSGDRIIEIAAVRFKNGIRAGTFHSLVDPCRPVSRGAFMVNGISDEMLEGAPSMKELLPGFVDFIRGSCLCAYNAPFDMGFLHEEFRRAGKRFPRGIVVVDILAMARRLLRLQRHALWYVAKSLGAGSGVQEHRALSDVELTMEVFTLLLEAARSKGISTFSEWQVPKRTIKS
jgi:DNA polymerase III epsilon subunit